MTEEYISGYLESISRVKDILTPYVGGTNQFFSIPKNAQSDPLTDIKDFLRDHINYYTQSEHVEPFEETLNRIKLTPMNNWEKEFPSLIKNWTCDEMLTSIHGKNGFLLSEYLVDFLLKDFFRNEHVDVYKMLPDWGRWHWGDHMSEEYIFVTTYKIYIMHFGESS